MAKGGGFKFEPALRATGFKAATENGGLEPLVKSGAQAASIVPWVGIFGNVVSLAINLKPRIYIDNTPYY